MSAEQGQCKSRLWMAELNVLSEHDVVPCFWVSGWKANLCDML